jgi:hypothetical protein
MTRGHLEYDNVILGLAPIDAAGTARATPWIDMATCHKISFLAMFGAATASAADVVTFTVECASVADSGAESAVPFVYRLSGGIGTNTWAAPTTSSSYGPLNSVVTGKMVYIEADPALMLATKADARYARLVTTQTSDTTAMLEALIAITQPRNKMATMTAATTA